jgi:hypothetical protein
MASVWGVYGECMVSTGGERFITSRERLLQTAPDGNIIIVECYNTVTGKINYLKRHIIEM